MRNLQAGAVLDPEVSRKKAPQFLILMIVSMELMVLSPLFPVGLRVISWWRLVNIFGALRADDAQSMAPRHFVISGSKLFGQLRRTKTTGICIRILQLPIFIPSKSYLVEEEWMEVGAKLVSSIGIKNRDYLIPRFFSDMKEARGVPATASDLAAMEELLVSQLRVVSVHDVSKNDFSLTEKKSIDPLLVSSWTGHSESSFIISALAAKGVPKTDRDAAGRWSPKGSDEYVRTYGLLVNGLISVFGQ